MAELPDFSIEDTLTEGDVRDFLKEKGVTDICELCGNTSWNFAINVRGLVPVISFKNFDDSEQHKIDLPYVIQGCSNCSNSRFYLKHSVAIWKLDKIAEGERNG